MTLAQPDAYDDFQPSRACGILVMVGARDVGGAREELSGLFSVGNLGAFGELIATSGSFKLREGLLVDTGEAAAPPATEVGVN